MTKPFKEKILFLSLMDTNHYFSENPSSDYIEEEINVDVLGIHFKIKSASGIFSRKELDNASRLLIESVFPFIKDGEKILDLGCGNGIIGIALALKKPKAFFVLSDINNRAVALARKNKKLLRLKYVEVVHSDVFENIKENFDKIVCNPPMATPKELRLLMIKESYAHLVPKGMIYMVTRHKKGGNIIEKGINDIFGNCSVIAKKGGFWVYSGEKKEQ
ncbi:MAG: rRNA (guanine1207-N2)-methyltransferase [Candidatus Woesearchaeota archaeon]|nr:rRNA (guanine1207-N2)-methyltransferase [Candidatus Woesearchaeota archaeon]